MPTEIEPLPQLPILESEVVGSILHAISQVQASLKEQQATLKEHSREFQSMRSQVADLDKRMDQSLQEIRRQVGELDVRLERQDLRLAAIESFPMPPIKQPSRLYATEAHSVSLPKRVRLGYAG